MTNDAQSPLSFLLETPYASRYPRKLAEGFPHVAHRIAELWDDKDALGDYFTELMVSKRPNRRGFPPDVGAEIVYLSMAYDLNGPIRPGPQEAPQTTTGPVDNAWDYERAVAELERRDIPLTMGQFVRAIEAGDQKLCALFLHAGFDIDSRDARQWTPLMIACFHGREALALELVRLGASVDAHDSDGYTPLHWASLNGYQQVCTVLLRRQADVNAISNAGITPLLQAAARGHLGVVLQLIERKARVNLAAADGSTPLLKAVANGHWDVINALLDAGASTEATMKSGATLVEIAARVKDVRIRERIAIAARMEARGDAPIQRNEPPPLTGTIY
jgi:ankyrin repeat protein